MDGYGELFMCSNFKYGANSSILENKKIVIATPKILNPMGKIILQGAPSLIKTGKLKYKEIKDKKLKLKDEFKRGEYYGK